jgi:hypothetical protein
MIKTEKDVDGMPLQVVQVLDSKPNKVDFIIYDEK